MAYEKVKQSGSVEEFGTGAVRDSQDGKPRPDLISPIFVNAVKNVQLPVNLSLRQYVTTLMDCIDAYGNNHNIENLAVAAKALMFVLHNQETLTFWQEPVNLSPAFYTRLGFWLMLGAKRYAERNWEAGIKLARSFTSLCRHRDQWLSNLQDEDHAGAMLCNLMFIYHTKVMIERGVLPKELEDFPNYE